MIGRRHAELRIGTKQLVTRKLFRVAGQRELADFLVEAFRPVVLGRLIAEPGT